MDSSHRARGKKRLEVVSEIVRFGGRVSVPIFALLAWFGRERRGQNVVGTIRRVLRECGLKTDPDFAVHELYDQYTMVEFQQVRRAPSSIGGRG